MSRSLHSLFLVHGSAADRGTWTIQLASSALRGRFAMHAYDRAELDTVEAQAADLAARITEPVIAAGSSFGAVVVLELARTRPELLTGMVLCEPPLPPNDDGPLGGATFVEELDRIAAERGGVAAAERFLRTVLTDAAYEKMPRLFQERATSKWSAIRADCHALARYQVRYPELRRIDVPALLLTGDRSAPYFRPTIDALAAHLPRARVEVLAGAGHMMHADAHRSFAERLIEFADELTSPAG
jgi:pimeloyl-ACP methyl ester carboxylesterase